MEYRNIEVKISTLISDLQHGKINLSPAFQRGQVWKPKVRQKLIKNILLRKPIPAIFWYKELKESIYTYNILDGKQRIESIILFIGNKRNDTLKISNWQEYFFSPEQRKNVHFPVLIKEGEAEKDVSGLTGEQAANLGEYIIPVIEITLNEETSMEDIISLFVDINQQGEPVTRFDIVKSMRQKDKMLKQAFDLIAIKQTRGKVLHYKIKNTSYSKVLRKLKFVEQAKDNNGKVDRMWEKLVEIILFAQNKIHKKPTDILKSFMQSGAKPVGAALDRAQNSELEKVFDCIAHAYAKRGVDKMKLAVDATNFYTMVTAMIHNKCFGGMGFDQIALRLHKFASLLEKKGAASARVRPMLKEYQKLSSTRTTDVDNRKKREELFNKIMKQF